MTIPVSIPSQSASVYTDEVVLHISNDSSKLYNEIYDDISIKQDNTTGDDSSPEIKLNVRVPKAPPGKPKVIESTPNAQLPDGSWNTFNGQPPLARFNSKGQRILPGGSGGSRFIPPEEYKEFLHLGHGGVFDLDLNNVDILPWRERGAEQDAYFNYGFNEKSWREYAIEIRRARIDAHLNNKIEIFSDVNFDLELPDEVRRALVGTNISLNSQRNVEKICSDSLPQRMPRLKIEDKIFHLNHNIEVTEQYGIQKHLDKIQYSNGEIILILDELRSESRRLQELFEFHNSTTTLTDSILRKLRQQVVFIKKKN